MTKYFVYKIIYRTKTGF